MVSGKSIMTIDQMLTPEVRVGTRFVHGSIWLEESLDIKLILFKHKVNLLLILSAEYLVKISSHFVLFIMETIEVRSSDGKDMLGHQLSHHTSREK